MTKLEIEILEILHRNRDGGFQTQRDRKKVLRMCARQLHELNYRSLETVHDLKGRHINALLEKWKKSSLSCGTLKNRMANLRWLVRKINKSGIISKSNKACGIANRNYIPDQSGAKNLEREILEKITDTHVALSLELQAAFGLRREEAMKFNVSYADRQDHIVLKSSWCKGGKSRDLAIRNAAQRNLLDRIHQFARGGSLIPASRNYAEHLAIFERQTATAGIGKTHGLRHEYAQTRYKELTGWKAPVAGGKHRHDLTPKERSIDRFARLVISRELGHEREQITANYLGR